MRLQRSRRHDTSAAFPSLQFLPVPHPATPSFLPLPHGSVEMRP